MELTQSQKDWLHIQQEKARIENQKIYKEEVSNTYIPEPRCPECQTEMKEFVNMYRCRRLSCRHRIIKP